MKKQCWRIGYMATLLSRTKTTKEVVDTRQALQEDRNERRACFRLGLAVEGQLQSIGHTGSDWIPSANYCRPLNATERRYKAPRARGVDDDCPASVAAHAFSYAIKDNATGAKRYEVPRYAPHEAPIWSVCVDSCTSNIGLLSNNTDSLHMLLQWTLDKFHRAPNDVDNACHTGCGIQPVE